MLYCDCGSIGRSTLVLRQIAISLGLLVVGSSPLGAQVTLDVSKLTCDQFAMYKVTNPKYLAVWLSGYDHGRRGDAVIDMQQVVAKIGRASCRERVERWGGEDGLEVN